jgi:hypothetical protein
VLEGVLSLAPGGCTRLLSVRDDVVWRPIADGGVAGGLALDGRRVREARLRYRNRRAGARSGDQRGPQAPPKPHDAFIPSWAVNDFPLLELGT